MLVLAATSPTSHVVLAARGDPSAAGGPPAAISPRLHVVLTARCNPSPTDGPPAAYKPRLTPQVVLTVGGFPGATISGYPTVSYPSILLTIFSVLNPLAPLLQQGYKLLPGGCWGIWRSL